MLMPLPWRNVQPLSRRFCYAGPSSPPRRSAGAVANPGLEQQYQRCSALHMCAQHSIRVFHWEQLSAHPPDQGQRQQSASRQAWEARESAALFACLGHLEMSDGDLCQHIVLPRQPRERMRQGQSNTSQRELTKQTSRYAEMLAPMRSESAGRGEIAPQSQRKCQGRISGSTHKCKVHFGKAKST